VKFPNIEIVTLFLCLTIEVYSDIVNPSFYAAFAWALLDSIADTSLHPPKLRPPREIECITKLDSEAVRLLLLF